MNNDPRMEARVAEAKAVAERAVRETFAERLRGPLKAALSATQRNPEREALEIVLNEIAEIVGIDKPYRELPDAVRALASRSTSGDSERLAAMTKATYSHVDGRDLLHQLQPNGAHHIDIIVRINGEDRRYEGDWLKTLTWARDGHNMGEYADNPKLRAHIEAARAAGDSSAGATSGALSATGTPRK